jgi:hypothetical protein
MTRTFTLKRLRYLIFSLRCVNIAGLLFVAILLKAPLVLIVVPAEVIIALIWFYLAVNTTPDTARKDAP